MKNYSREERGRPNGRERRRKTKKADEVNVNQSTIVRCLKKLRKVWKLFGWVSHELFNNHKEDGVWILTDSLQINEQDSFLKNHG